MTRLALGAKWVGRGAYGEGGLSGAGASKESIEAAWISDMTLRFRFTLTFQVVRAKGQSRAFSAFTALSAFSVIPFGAGWKIWHWHVNGAVADVNISLILIFALGSLGIYGFIVGGWASESKYSLLGSMRTCAQMVSYEVSLALSVLGVVLMASEASYETICAQVRIEPSSEYFDSDAQPPTMKP